MGLNSLLQGYLYFFYLDEVYTPYETRLWTSTACYGIALLLYMEMMFVPYRKHTYESPWPVTG
jgi:hypothetical protein